MSLTSMNFGGFFPQEGQPYNTRCIIYTSKEWGWWSQGQHELPGGDHGFLHRADDHGRWPGGVPARAFLGDFYGNAALPFAETFNLNLTNGAHADHRQANDLDVDGDTTNLLYSLFIAIHRLARPNCRRRHARCAATASSISRQTVARDIRLRLDVASQHLS